MTLRLFDGFDAYLSGSSEWTNDSMWGTVGAVGNVSTASRFGRGSSLNMPFGSEKIFNHGNNDTQVIVGVLT